MSNDRSGRTAFSAEATGRKVDKEILKTRLSLSVGKEKMVVDSFL